LLKQFADLSHKQENKYLLRGIPLPSNDQPTSIDPFTRGKDMTGNLIALSVHVFVRKAGYKAP
jgi:hypothetical protein